jgi:phage gpG-like protein
MFRIQMSVEGELVVDRVLQGLEDRARDVSPAWPKVVDVFRAIVNRAFETEGASTGATWPPLKPSTQAQRRRLGYGPAHPILQRTQQLRRALTIGEGAYIATTPTSLRYLLDERNARIFTVHQSRRPRTRLPRRAPVLLTADDRTALMHPIRLYITGRDVNAPRRARVG